MGCRYPIYISEEKKASEANVDLLQVKPEMSLSKIIEKEEINSEMLDEGIQRDIQLSIDKLLINEVKDNNIDKVREQSKQIEKDVIKNFTMSLGIFEKDKTITKIEDFDKNTETCET